MKPTNKVSVSFLSFLFLFVIVAGSCKKETTADLESAVITGPDLRECVCCGGWFIEIGDSTKRFYSLPAGTDIDLLQETFPLDVRVRWEDHDPQCLGDEIDITQIARQ